MLQYPNIDPVAVSIGPVQIHWYGLMYVIGIGSAWVMARHRAYRLNLTEQQIDDFVFYCALGVVIGGRIGYTLFYNFPSFLEDPLSFFKVWQGGMSFHGGFLGVFVSCAIFAKKLGKSVFSITDFIIPMVPIGLFFGRLGNFINGELWGKTTVLSWAMVFPGAGLLPRHPTQLYEALLEGVVLFIVLWFYSRVSRPTMTVSGVFLILYGLFRFIIELVREPDQHLGYLAFEWVTMGQILSVPMFVAGLLLFYIGKSRTGSEN